MGNQISMTQTLPNGLTPLLSKSLGSQDLARHRATLALELEVLAKKVDRFGWERDRGTHAHDRLLTDWMDALQDYPLEEIKAACVEAILANPNKMPNEGHVRAQILKARAKVVAMSPKPVEPEESREEATPASKAAIEDLVKDFTRRATQGVGS